VCKDVEAPRDWWFVQMADSQLGLLNAESDDWSQEVECLELAVNKVNAFRPRPKFCVVCGDLTNEFPTGSAERGRKQVADFKRCVARIDAAIPLVCVCGNHDVGDLPTRESIQLYRSRFGPDYGAFKVGESKCLVVNSQLYSLKANGDSRFADAQDAWLRREIAEDDALIVLKHIPPFIVDPDEPEGYFNLPPAIRRDFLDLFRNKKVTIFCGHFHRNAGGSRGNVEVVVTSAVGTTLPWKGTTDDGTDLSVEARIGLGGFNFDRRACDPASSGFRLVHVSRDVVRHKWFALADVPDGDLTPATVFLDDDEKGGGNDDA